MIPQLQYLSSQPCPYPKILNPTAEHQAQIDNPKLDSYWDESFSSPKDPLQTRVNLAVVPF